MNKFYLLLLFVFSVMSVKAQDVHFSQYYTYSPNLNPALAGNFEGSYRVGIIYRNQWFSSLNQYAFVTPAVHVDVPLFEGLLKGDKLGVGAFVLNDQSGSAGLSHLNAGLSVAYHKAFGKNDQHRFSFGVQGAYNQKRIDPKRTTFYDQFDEITWSGYNPTSENLTRTQFQYADVSAGIYWKSRFSKLVAAQAGVSAYHLAEPNQAFIIVQNNLSPLYRRITADLGLEFTINDKWIIAPDALYSLQGPVEKMTQMQEIVFGGNVGIKINDGFRNKSNLFLGCRYRWKDAVIPMISGEFRNVRLGISYDVTMSDYKKSNRGQGALEVSLMYTGESIRSFKANKTLPARRF